MAHRACVSLRFCQTSFPIAGVVTIYTHTSKCAARLPPVLTAPGIFGAFNSGRSGLHFFLSDMLSLLVYTFNIFYLFFLINGTAERMTHLVIFYST